MHDILISCASQIYFGKFFGTFNYSWRLIYFCAVNQNIHASDRDEIQVTPGDKVIIFIDRGKSDNIQQGEASG